MQPTSVAKAVEYAGRAFPGESREKLLRRINMVRQVMWLSPDKREMVFRDEGQERVQNNYDFANYGYRSCFTSITLPATVRVAEFIEINGRRIPIDSAEPRNTPAGIYMSGKHRPTASLKAVSVPLQNDIPRYNRGPVVIQAVNASDNGKRAGIEYVTADGGIVREDILISASGPETTQVPVQVLKLTLPQRDGFIKVLTADGFELGHYHPSIIAPKHIRVHINGACCNQIVHWIGLREPIDVIFDSDVVEMSSEFSWQTAFTWIDLHLKTTRSKEESQAYAAIASFDAAASASDLKAELGSPGVCLRPTGSRVVWNRLRSINSRRRGYGSPGSSFHSW
jgi:hypothetical protein